MRLMLTIAVLLAVVATALVGVCQYSETRRLEHDVWQMEKQRDRLERARRGLEATIEERRTPRHLLTQHDRANQEVR
ncbi:MAG: hypothetical protein O2894_07775 [Planctomycetota bacterium]|nr:hypothetical protein [Planctomycetota bacterium]